MRKAGQERCRSCRMRPISFEDDVPEDLRPPDRVRGLFRVAPPASNLEVFSRGLAAVGDFLVFHRLSFIERRKTGLLDRRNMHEHVLAASRGLDKSETLGRVKPLHSTFSHHVVSAGLKTITIGRSLETGLSDGRTIRVMGGA